MISETNGFADSKFDKKSVIEIKFLNINYDEAVKILNIAEEFTVKVSTAPTFKNYTLIVDFYRGRNLVKLISKIKSMNIEYQVNK